MFSITLAGVPIAVNARHTCMKQLCADFLTDIPTNECAFHVSASVEEVQAIVEEIVQAEAQDENRPITQTLTPGYSEAIALHTKICEQLLAYNILFLHAAAIEYEGRAYAFCAPSGTGKLTHVRLWCDQLRSKVRVINGDKPLLRYENGGFTVYGSPMKGTEGWGQNISAPLEAICFIYRAPKDKLEPLNDETEILGRLGNQLIVARKPESAMMQLNLLDRLLDTTQFFLLRCTPKPSAFFEAFKMTRR
ncbi:MAG: hypothetical protein ACI4B9_03610 [Eggerthellaceae bacterium]